MAMTFYEFHNGLRILLNLDRHDLEAAQVIKVNDHDAWGEFQRDPFRFFIRVDDQRAKRLWELLDRRARRGD